MLRSVIAAVLVIPLGCAEEPEEPPPPPAVLSTAPAAVQLRDSTVNDAIAQVAAATGRPIVVDAGAATVARCARISLQAPTPLPPDAMLDLLATAMQPAGLRLERSGPAAIVRRVEGHPLPADCERPAPRLPLRDLRPSSETEHLSAGIREDSEHSFAVTRAVRDELAGRELGSLMGMVRVIPHTDEQGQLVGQRVYGVRRSSVPGLLGIQNGDTIRRVAGRELRSPEDFDAARRRIRTADSTTVDITRRGEDITLRYRFVDSLPPAPPPAE